ncbi:PH domain-containing protein [Bacillus sp. T33-2]|uniref:PH domain-containing protein n=1 Tax=Bacillus sp. T33-2 TaxID=2054168 RepID=UPI000C7751DF|nr:PH domain-containing protein [Bacillus sp. T33-2]PLR94123.1 hypothetical protein CVD19_17730 [Bacillus sp. T33-2]
MKNSKRYSPLLMLFELWQLVKNLFFFYIFLFVIKAQSELAFITYGRILFLIIIGIALIYIVLKWWTHKYEMDDKSFHLYNGIFNKSERIIPFSKIQNINRHTSLFHRIFNVTAINIETGVTGEEADVKFEVLPKKVADEMERLLASSTDNIESEEQNAQKQENATNRTIHFKPTNKDTLKASFTSLSFLFLIPLLVSIYSNVNDIFDIEEKAAGFFGTIIGSGWVLTTLLIVFTIASVVFGIARTFIKYGKYEISSDEKRIYIIKGVIDESAFSIAKDKVQAIEIKQSFLKKMLGLAEVKLTSSGSVSMGEQTQEINSLYPFLPMKRAYEMLSEILPAYEITERMSQLPKKSLGIRLLRSSWVWILGAAVLCYFKPAVLGWEQAWWILSAALFCFTLVLVLLDFFNTRYVLNENFIQIKTGSLTTSLFVSKRDKVIEVAVTQNILQKLLGVASINTINRADPVQHTVVDDVPMTLASSFFSWYKARRTEIKVE